MLRSFHLSFLFLKTEIEQMSAHLSPFLMKHIERWQTRRYIDHSSDQKECKELKPQRGTIWTYHLPSLSSCPSSSSSSSSSSCNASSKCKRAS